MVEGVSERTDSYRSRLTASCPSRPSPNSPPSSPSHYQCPGPFSRRRLALVGQGAEGTCRAASQDRLGLGRTEGGGPAARSGLPASAGRLPCSLPCQALACCVFHLLGNRGDAPAQPTRLRPAHGA